MNLKPPPHRKERDAHLDAVDQLSTLMDSMPDFVCFKDEEGRWIEANAFALKVFQLEKVDYKGKKNTELVPANHLFHEALKECDISDEEAWQRGRWRGVETIPRADGGMFVFDVIKMPSFNPDGSRRGLTIVGRDITERKWAEDELQIHHCAIESSVGAVALADLEGKVTYVNPACAHMWGYEDKSEMLGRSALEFWAYPENARQIIAGVLQGKSESSEREAKRKDGTWFDVHISVSLVRDDMEKPLRLMLSAVDITERKKAEKALKSSLSLLHATLESTPSGILVVDRNRHILLWNRQFAEMWRIPEDILTTRHDETVLNTVISQLAQPAEFLAKIQELYEHPEELGFDEFDLADGRTFTRYSQPTKIGDNIEGRVWSFHDITERKRAEEALRESEERHRSIIQKAMDGYWLVDEQGRLLEVNEAYCEMSGYTADELASMRIADLEANETPDKTAEHAQMIMAQGEDRFESRHRRKDGSLFDVEVSVQYRPADRQFVVFLHDITECAQLYAYREMGREVLEILNVPGDSEDFVPRILTVLKKGTGFDALGIRLQDGEDFPYLVQEGFSKDFLMIENSLLARGRDGGVCRGKDGNVCLECTCGLVLCGVVPTDHPFFTKGGSFWSNDTSPLLHLLPSEEPRLNPRNNCIHHGYASVALVPIRSKEKIVGLIQFNDRRKGCFTLEIVELMEGVAAHLGAALLRKQTEEKLKQKMHDLERFNALTVDRELRMVELKKEINALLENLGKKPKYKIAE